MESEPTCGTGRQQSCFERLSRFDPQQLSLVRVELEAVGRHACGLTDYLVYAEAPPAYADYLPNYARHLA